MKSLFEALYFQAIFIFKLKKVSATQFVFIHPNAVMKQLIFKFLDETILNLKQVFAVTDQGTTGL